ncbi:hypothetical protein DL897_13110 [Thermoflavimicrobium daqui]|uniref:Spore germination GerD central core domain-containing protein n=2 Tax=Thermoflavimicrobium daqui TaxID=2137476 RepID=A0A364K3K0_9BACL|nr:hypothetical protein DL897_13110 [Thermoflavimicrobium daqui]
MYRKYFLFVLILIFSLTSCSSPSPEAGTTPDYQKTKEMVLDLIRTSEGKKALKDLMSDPEFKQAIIVSNQELEETISKSLTNQHTKKEWEKLLSKPKVADNLAKATEKQQKELVKILLKDPEYQKLLLDIMKDPAFSKQVIQLLKSQEFRKETMKVMEEAIQIPSFQEKLKKLFQQGGQKGGEGGGGGAGGAGGGGGGGGATGGGGG